MLVSSLGSESPLVYCKSSISQLRPKNGSFLLPRRFPEREFEQSLSGKGCSAAFCTTLDFFTKSFFMAAILEVVIWGKLR